MIGAGHLVRVLVVPLLSATLLLPRTASHADERSGSFRATFSGTDQLTVCGTNTYCISDQGTGHAIGFGAATLVAAETESLVDPTSPCGFQVAGTATLSGAAGDSLSLQFFLADAQELHFAAPGNFGQASTTFDGPGLLFLAHGIPPVGPAHLSYDGSGRIVVSDPATRAQLCAALS